MNVIDKLTANRFFWLFVLVFFASFSLWLRSSLFGFDSYATLSAIRFGWFDSLGGQPVANIVWNLLPDSLFVFNLIMFLSLYFSVVPIWLLIKHFYDERLAWLATFLLISLSPIFLFGFGELENEVLAFPFIVWSIYLLLTKRYWLSVSFGAAGLLFWKWVHYLTFFNFGGHHILEMRLFANVLSLWLLIPFLFVIPFIKNKKIKCLGLICLGLWLWNAKLFILLLPFVGLAIAEVLALLEFGEFKLFFLRFLQNNWNYVYILAFFCLIGWNVSFYLQLPSQNTWIMVDEAIKLSEDKNLPLYNDWSYGYWLWSKGIKTTNNGGTGNNRCFDKKLECLITKGIYLVQTDLNCLLLKRDVDWVRATNIYECN